MQSYNLGVFPPPSSIFLLSPLSSLYSPQLDGGGRIAVAEGVGGAAAVREELPGLQGHGEHFTSVCVCACAFILLCCKQ